MCSWTECPKQLKWMSGSGLVCCSDLNYFCAFIWSCVVDKIITYLWIFSVYKWCKPQTNFVLSIEKFAKCGWIPQKTCGKQTVIVCISSCIRVNRSLIYSKWSLPHGNKEVHFLYLQGNHSVDDFLSAFIMKKSSSILFYTQEFIIF